MASERDRKFQSEVEQLTGMGFSKEDARAALEDKKTFQDALDYLLNRPDPTPTPPVVAAPKPAAKQSYAAMAGGASAPAPSAAPPLLSSSLERRPAPPSDLNVPIARPGHAALPSPRYQSKEEEDYEKAIKESLVGTANRDASGEPLDPNERKRQNGIPAGLKNVGNTCYFNSLVHIYNSLPPFRNIILRLPWREPSMVDPPEVVALLELQRLFGFLSVSPRRYQDPTTLVKLLVEARGPGAKLGTQEDPTEFNLHFLKQIRSGIKRLDAEAHRKISDFFKGTQIQRVQSKEKDGAPTEVLTKERSGQIILDLRDNRPQSIYTCLDDFTQPAVIDDYITPKKHVAQATRYVTWESFPPVLFFQLQRALYDREQKQLVKLSTPYTIETTIYLDRYLESNFADVLKRRTRAQEMSEEMRRAESSIEAMQNFHGSKLSLAQTLQYTLEHFTEETRKMSDGPGLGAVKRRQQMTTAVEAITSELATVGDRLAGLQKQVESLKSQRDGLFNDMKRLPYRLHAVLVHDGRSVGSGHYWAYLYERDAERWILYNDQHVSIVTEDEVLTLKPPRNRQDCQPTVYSLVYLSDKLVQQSIGMKCEALPNLLSILAERDAKDFTDELTRWNDAKAAGRNPDPMGQRVDAFKVKFFARLEGCIADVGPKSNLPDGRLRSFAHYLLSIDSQDLMQYELASEVWRELYPESSFTYRHGEFPRRLEEALDQVPWRLQPHQEAQLKELRAEFRTVLQLADWIQAGLGLLVQERWFEAVVYLLHAYKRDRTAPRKRFPDLADYTRLCLLGVARNLWQQIEGGDYASALDQGWKLAVLVIDDFPSRNDPLCVLLRTEWNRHLAFLESKSAMSSAVPMDLVRRIRDMYALHTTRHATSIRLTEPDRTIESQSVSTIYERYAAAVLSAQSSRSLINLRKMLYGTTP